jgi:peroxiredoxin
MEIPMNVLDAGNAFPKLTVPELQGGMLTLGAPQGGHDWQLVVVYRGLHCPICKTYLAKLEDLVPEFKKIGVDVVAVSGDPKSKARQMANEQELSLTIGYDLSIAQMHELGLYVSSPRSPLETDQPFPEPALFVINAAGEIQIIDLSNAPFARPDLQSLLNGLTFVRDKGYPIRGTHKAA